MEHLTSWIKLVFALAITAAFITLGTTVLQQHKAIIKYQENEIATKQNELRESELDKFDGTIITGADVKSALKKYYKTYEVVIRLKNNVNYSVSNISSLYSGTTSTLKPEIFDTQDESSQWFINDTDLFSADVDYGANGSSHQDRITFMYCFNYISNSQKDFENSSESVSTVRRDLFNIVDKFRRTETAESAQSIKNSTQTINIDSSLAELTDAVDKIMQYYLN
jgi:hypothetical protein